MADLCLLDARDDLQNINSDNFMKKSAAYVALSVGYVNYGAVWSVLVMIHRELVPYILMGGLVREIGTNFGVCF